MVCHKPKDEKSAVSPAVTRFKRRQNRSQKKVESEVTAAEALPPPDTTEEPPLEDGKEVQTDVTGPLMASMMDELQTLRTENRALTLQVQNTVHKYDKSFFEGKPEKVLLYTGFPTFQILLTLFVYLEPFLPTKKSLNKFEMLILTLMRLRLNVTASFLAYEFNVSLSTVSRVLIDVIDVMFVRMKPLIIWPSRENLRKTMPIQFRKYFGTKCVVIIDCFEVFIDRPSNLKARAETWSSYKHHNTVKFLIGITPQGTVSYISKAWGGRVSDKYITEHDGFLNNILPGDLVLADRGFDIQATVGAMMAEVKIPAFTRGKNQLAPVDIETTRKIAHVRIHVERVIGTVRQKILHSKWTFTIRIFVMQGK
ncbi:uncharacterized protein LOC121367048 [Gigantopelta aegis]|uniref:uncharacterized protein LOC121367048 n=1 Tax=Gigantopelta aegis TaxID=1735272 RepID=UPI001B88B3C5|nr:uncharacterized protein LOC121367048 [Gigantopelta aegis]